MTDIKVEVDGRFIVYKQGDKEIYDMGVGTFNGFRSVRECISDKSWATEELIIKSEAIAKDVASGIYI